MDSYAQHLRTFRFWNRLGIVTVVALLPVVAFGAFMAQRFSDVHALPLLLGAMWLVALGNALYRIRTFRCPRCEKTFSVHGWWMPNTRGRKCVHCALDLDGEVQPAGAPVVKSINLAEKLASFNEHWKPRTVGEFNGHDLMVVKVKGEFIWHKHDETDDFFLVLKGRLTIRLREGNVTLGPGEMFVVPKGMEHCPVAEEEVHMLLIEPTGTPNTGDARTAAPRRVI